MYKISDEIAVSSDKHLINYVCIFIRSPFAASADTASESTKC
jgi:hypothetical protein